MNMKTLSYCVITAAFISCTYGQAPMETSPKWNALVNVLDQNGVPVPGADVEVSYYVPAPADRTAAGERVHGLTDTNGVYRFSHENTGSISLSFRATKPGYYPTSKGHEFATFAENDRNKWNPVLTLVLKQIGHPVPMYARKVQLEIPKLNKPIGFDLTESDWVAPYGTGKQSDFIFEAERRWVSRKDFDSKLTVSFPNSGDGLIPIAIPLDQGSELRLPALAPSEGYIPTVSRHLGNTPSESWKDDEEKDRNYYFRVRTVLNAGGRLKTALFGKIHGDFTIDPINSKTMWIIFTYYLNPTPNDQNVEYDLNRNLLTNVSSMGQVKEP